MKAFALLIATAALAAAASEPEVRVYKTADRELKAHLLYPEDWTAADRRPLILFFFNGGWGRGNPERQFDEQARYFTARGAVTARVDYRIKTRQGVEIPRAGIEDIASAVRWFRARAGQFGVDPDRLIAGGGSGSGHLPALAYYADEIRAAGDDPSISPLPNALWVFHPDFDDLDPEMHLRLRTDGEGARRLPPTVVFAGTRDPSFALTSTLAGAIRANGGEIELFAGRDAGHGFYQFSPWMERTTERADGHARALGLMPADPAADLPSRAAPPGFGQRIEENSRRWLDRHRKRQDLRAEWLASRPPVEPEVYVYKEADGERLALEVLRPRGARPSEARPALVLFEGGGFSPPRAGDSEAEPEVGALRRPGAGFQAQAEYFRDRGLVTIRVGYRKRKRDGAQPEATISDAITAMRWIRLTAAEFGIDPERIVAGGGSAGGQLSSSLYALPHMADPDDLDSVSPRPAALLLYYPLLNWLDGGPMTPRFLEALNGDRERAARLSTALNWGSDPPPTLILIGTRDPAFEFVRGFAESRRSRGEPMELFVGEGGNHGFSNFSPWLERTTERADEFLRSLGYLGDEPRVPLPTRARR